MTALLSAWIIALSRSSDRIAIRNRISIHSSPQGSAFIHPTPARGEACLCGFPEAVGNSGVVFVFTDGRRTSPRRAPRLALQIQRAPGSPATSRWCAWVCLNCACSESHPCAFPSPVPWPSWRAVALPRLLGGQFGVSLCSPTGKVGTPARAEASRPPNRVLGSEGATWEERVRREERVRGCASAGRRRRKSMEHKGEMERCVVEVEKKDPPLSLGVPNPWGPKLN